MAKVQRRAAIPPKESEVDKFSWRNPLFRDVDAFLERIAIYIDMYGSAHVALPKARNKKFVDALNSKGYIMTKIEANAPQILNKNQAKKMVFYAITRAR